jgi:hypothetical protein
MHLVQPRLTSYSNIGTSIYKPNDPPILLARPRSLAYRARIWDTQCLAESQVCSIRACLVPALDSCCDRVEDNGKVECAGQFEPMGDFFADSGTVVFVEFFEFFEESGRLGEESAFDEQGLDVG